MTIDVTPCVSDNSLLLKEGVSEKDVIQIAELKGVYRRLKRIKRVWRDTADIIFHLDEEDTAVISCCLQNGKLIVWRPVLVRKYDTVLHATAVLSYLCVKREGIFCYPAADIREILLQENDKVPFLATWKEEQEISKKQISEMVQKFKIRVAEEKWLL